MIPSRLMQRRVTLLRAAKHVDRYGTTTLDWGEGAESRSAMGELQPRSNGENLQGRSLETTDAVLYLDPGTDIEADDRVVADDGLYFVVGPPLHLYRRGQPHHIIANVRKAVG